MSYLPEGVESQNILGYWPWKSIGLSAAAVAGYGIVQAVLAFGIVNVVLIAASVIMGLAFVFVCLVFNLGFGSSRR